MKAKETLMWALVRRIRGDIREVFPTRAEARTAHSGYVGQFCDIRRIAVRVLQEKKR